jgi:hypothetical protein
MDESYDLIRDGLIALLCVGDKIFHLYHGLGYYDHKKEKFTTPYKIKQCTIIEVNDSTIRILTPLGYDSTHSINMIDVYKGQLYIWDAARPYDYTLRVEKMIELIEADTTVFEDY